MPSPCQILVVDNELGVRELLHDYLNDLGARVILAHGGSAALQCLEQALPDLILSDLNMPRMDGVQFYHAAVSAHPELRERFVFMSAYHGEALEIPPGCPVVDKPFNLAALGTLLKSRLGGTQRMANRQTPEE